MLSGYVRARANMTTVLARFALPHDAALLRGVGTEPVKKEHGTPAVRPRHVSKHLVDNVTNDNSSESWREDWTLSSSGAAAVSDPHQALSEEFSGHSALRTRIKMRSCWDRNGVVAGEDCCVRKTSPYGRSLRAAFDAARQHEVIEASQERQGAIRGRTQPQFFGFALTP